MAVAPPGGRLLFSDPINLNQCWIDATTSPALAAFNTANPTYFDAYAIAACAAINKMCNRYFNEQQADDVFIDKSTVMGRYQEFSLENRPITTLDKVYLQVVDTFSEISTDYIQLDTQKGLIKILASAYTAPGIAFSPFVNTRMCNVWVRYTSGYTITKVNGAFTVNKVPKPVQLATALYMTYLLDMDGVDGSVDTFKTLNYSQKNSGGANSAKMQAIMALLKPYIKYSAIGTGDKF